MTSISIIGGGPGGYVAAIRAAQLGAEVTLVERGKLGGTCLNAGCIPTKALLHTAELYEQAVAGAAHGVVCQPVVDFSRVQARKQEVVDRLVGGVTRLLRSNRVTVLRGTARLTGARTVAVTTADGQTTLTPDRLILAVGSVPVMPPIPGIDSPQCIDSTGALALTEVPRRLLVIGGGVIGVEFATVYASLGSEVTIVELLEQILSPADAELAAIVRSGLVARGVRVLTGARVVSIADRGAAAAVEVTTDGGSEAIEAEKVLVSVGRRADTAALGLDDVGIVHDRGRITVDASQRTNVDGVYAIGDCTGGSMLAHVASAQGEVSAEHAMGHASAYDGRTSPACVYTNPEYAGVGLTEEQAKARGYDYVVGRFPLAANGKSLIVAGDGMVKLIAGRRYGEILGVHMVGPRATDLIAEGALAIGLEATVDEFIGTIHAHPTVAEAMREAALAVQGRAIHVSNPQPAGARA